MRLLRLIARVFWVSLLASLGLLILLWLDHNQPTTLPQPTGSFAVGRTTFTWRDTTQTDSLAPEPNTPRQLLAWLWYPATLRQPAPLTADYLPAPWRTAFEHHMGLLLTQFFTRDLARVRTHSVLNASVSAQQRTYPVVFLRAGLAALTTDYTSLAEELASHGYLVVGLDAPYRSVVVVLPNELVIPRIAQNNVDLVSGSQKEQLATKLVRAWSADMRWALDELHHLNRSDPSGRFRGRLDLQRVGIVGHSLGGASGLQFCQDDPRCRTCIDLDGIPFGSVVQAGITQPFLFLGATPVDTSDAQTRVVMTKIRSIYQRLPPDRRFLLNLPGGTHFGFSDQGALLKSPVLMWVLHQLGVVKLAGPHQLALTGQLVRCFFDVYLQGAPVATFRQATTDPAIALTP